MRKFIAAFLVLLAPVAFAEAPAKAKRLALVIGNAAYRDAPLANPLNDAADMAAALEASGFTVIRRENATLRELHLALREFGDRLDRQGVGVFYFAGHGMQVRGRNYLIPVDADIAREDEVAFAALDLGAVMDKLDSAKNPVNIVILDACRNNPFGTRLQATAKGLAQVDAPPGTLIAFATAPGSTAADGAGRNGLYTQHLVKSMQSPGAPIEQVFKAVRAAVRADSRGAQIPWESTSLESDFRFRAAPKKPVAVALSDTKGRVSAPRSAIAVNAPPTLAAGDEWTYRVSNELDGSERKWQLRVKELRGDEVHYTNGNVTDLFGNNLRVTHADGLVESYTPATQWYVFPMRAGNAWELKSVQVSRDSSGKERVFDLDIKLSVVGEEDVDIAAGRMRAVRIERVLRWKQRSSENAGVRTGTIWYNGAVKRWILLDDKSVTAKGKVTLHERSELASYSVK